MSGRERVLAGTLGVMFASGIVYLGVRKLYVDRLAQREADTIKVANDLAKLRRENRRVQGLAESISGWAALTFDDDELRVSTKLGAVLMALVERAGLSPEKLSLQPVGGARVRGAYREIGRTISVRGKIERIVDFLYLLEDEPHLHRLDNISITPVPKTNEANLQVRYITVVLDGAPTGSTPTSGPTTTPSDLDGEGRKLYDAIASRDLFRPYIQRIVVPPPPPPPPTPTPRATPRAAPVAKPTPPPDPGRFRLVGLPEWRDKHDVIVEDTQTRQVRVYKAGETLAGGTLVMVDYRPLPSPANPQILSPSRAIVRVGPDYWAVELGQSLTHKRRLKPEQLPKGISPPQQPAPADDKVKKSEPAER